MSQSWITPTEQEEVEALTTWPVSTRYLATVCLLLLMMGLAMAWATQRERERGERLMAQIEAVGR